jgi:hypothetical protein
MKSLFASMFVTAMIAVACGGPQKKPEGAIVEEKGSGVPETCCCKTTPSTSEDGKPQYQMASRMDCSNMPGTGGECVDDIQCNAVKSKSTDSDMH